MKISSLQPAKALLIIALAGWVAGGCSSINASSNAGSQAPVPGAVPPPSGWTAALDTAVGMPDAQDYRVQTFEWVDATRERPVPSKLYLPQASAPATATATARTPLVVVSHGIGGSREGYSYIGKFLAANGIASLHLQHAGSDRALWFGNPVTMLFRLQGAAQPSEAIARAKDVSFALDQVFADATLAAQLDPAKIAMTGHSYGANTALLVSGARVEQGEQALEFTDARIKASVVISAPPFYGQGDAGAILGNIQVPTLHITSQNDDITIPGYRSGVEDRVKVYEAVGQQSKSTKVLAVFKAGSHSMFTDRLYTGGAEHNPKVKRATRELILAFLQTQFSNAKVDPIAMSQWAIKHAEIVAQTKVQ